MTNPLRGFWHPDRSAPSSKHDKKGKVRVTGTFTLQMPANGKSNSTIKYPTQGISEFGRWFARHFPQEAKTLIGALKETLNE